MLPTASPDEDPPAFGIIVYISKTDGGQTSGRVANLEGIQVTAATERDVLGRIVSTCKAAIQAATQKGEDPPWIDPPRPKEAGEQKRFLPLHL